jgi:hypothetical protein
MTCLLFREMRDKAVDILQCIRYFMAIRWRVHSQGIRSVFASLLNAEMVLPRTI